MQSPFETTPGAAAIPIIFATKTTWAGIASELPEQARRFAASNDFSAKPGKCLTLPAPDGKIAQPDARQAAAPGVRGRRR